MNHLGGLILIGLTILSNVTDARATSMGVEISNNRTSVFIGRVISQEGGTFTLRVTPAMAATSLTRSPDSVELPRVFYVTNATYDSCPRYAQYFHLGAELIVTVPSRVEDLKAGVACTELLGVTFLPSSVHVPPTSGVFVVQKETVATSEPPTQSNLTIAARALIFALIFCVLGALVVLLGARFIEYSRRRS